MPRDRYVVQVEAAIYRVGRYLLIQRSLEEAHAPGTLALPGGKVEAALADEPLLIVEHTLRREVREEVGLEVQALAYVYSNFFEADDGDPCVALTFLASVEAGEPSISDPAEVAGFVWVSAADIETFATLPPWTRQALRYADQARRQMGW